MIGSVYEQLVSALKDGSVGFQTEIAAVEALRGVTLPSVPVSHIYGLDQPVNLAETNCPFLTLSPAATGTERVKSAGNRDSVHTIGFEAGFEEPDENKARQYSIYWAEALMRFLDNFNANNSDYVGTSGTIVVLGWRADYTVVWQQPPNAIRGFTLEADILARDTFDT